MGLLSVGEHINRLVAPRHMIESSSSLPQHKYMQRHSLYGGVEQFLVAHWIHNTEVGGSNPPPAILLPGRQKDKRTLYGKMRSLGNKND